MFATETGRSIPISGRGYPVKIGMDKLIPFDFPKAFMMIKKGAKPGEIFDGEWEEYMVKKEGTSCLVRFQKSILMNQSNGKIDVRAYCPAAFVRFCDVPAMVTVSRIVSSFLRTHKFPAFNDAKHFETLKLEDIQETLQLRWKDDKLEGKENKRRKLIESAASGNPIHGYYEPCSDEGFKTKINFTSAKAQTPSSNPWGSVNDMPNSSGIHFPYVPELSKPDKETVPRVIGDLFIRCLHEKTESCLTNYSDLTLAWKASLFNTQWGQEMSHLFRVIEIGFRAQARIYPIVESRQYLGCFLSGDGYSVGIGKRVYRPDPYSQCVEESRCYNTSERVMDDIAALVAGVDEAKVEKVKEWCKDGIRALSQGIAEEWTVSGEDQAVIVKLVCELRTGQVYRTTNAVNMAWALKGIASGIPPDETEPMYGGALFERDIFSLYLSVFGPLAPSPEILGAPVLKLQQRLPDKFGKVLGIRLVSLSQSVQDWKNAAQNGFIHNGVVNLSAPYEHSAITGQEAKELWFTSVFEFSEWYRNKGPGSRTGGKDKVEDGGVKIVAEDGFDFADF